MIIEGKVSVKAALLGGKRRVEKIYMDASRHDKEVHFIQRKAEEYGVEIVKLSREEIDAIATGRTHGGILAEVGNRQYQELEACISSSDPFLVLVEGVEDPFNLGYIIRSLYSAGCSGLILKTRNWENVESTIMKSSAGASEYMNIIMVDDAQFAVQTCKNKGLHVYAAMRKDAIPYFEADFKKPILLCIGGEMRGLSTSVLKEVNQNIYIPYANDFRNALNAAGASAAIGFEVLRQRKF